MRTGLSTVFQSLEIRNYRLFAVGQLVKLIGVWAQFITQDWLVLQLSHNSPTALGLVSGLQFAPILLLTLYAGRLADRYDKRKLLLGVNTAFAIATLVLGVLVATGSVTLWHVFGFAAVIGVINSVETPVRQSFVSELVPMELLPNALSLASATFNTARLIGPAVAGLAIDHIGMGPVFLADAALCTAPLVGLFRMRPADLYRTFPASAGPQHARIIDGLRYVGRRPDLLVPMLLVLVLGLFGFNFQITLAVMAKTVFAARASTFGLLSTCLACGALSGALVGSRRRTRPALRVVVVSAMAFGVFETLVGFAQSFVVAGVLLVPVGFFMIAFNQASNQRVQLGTDAEYRGRVMALYVLVFLGTTPIGAPVAGWCAEHFGPRSTLWLGGGASLAAALVVAAFCRAKRSGPRGISRSRSHEPERRHPMIDMPAVNTLVHVVVHEDAGFRSRIEDIDGTKLTIAAPLEAVDLELPSDGFELEVFWNRANARYMLPVRMTARTRGQLAKWHLQATGEPIRDNRRQFVRGEGGPITVSTALDVQPPRTYRGYIVDVCEGGVRCHLAHCDFVLDQIVTLSFSLEGSVLDLVGIVLSLRPKDDGKGIDVIIGYEVQERQAQVIRRHVMQWQMAERRRQAMLRDQRLAS